MFFVWGRYARIAKKCGQVFTTHSFTNPILYPCLNYILPQTFHSLNFRINIKEKHATFLYRMLATGEWREFKLNLLTPLHKAGVAEAVGQNRRHRRVAVAAARRITTYPLKFSELAPSLRKCIQLGKRQSHFLWGDPI